MKLRVSPKRVITIYFFLGLVTGLMFYGIPGYIWPPTEMHYFVMVVWFLSTIGYLISSLINNYYLIEKDGLHHHRFNKDMIYLYKDVIYIDEKYSRLHKTLKFVTSFGHIRYLPFDEHGLIFDNFLEKCQNLLSNEELQSRFPNIH